MLINLENDKLKVCLSTFAGGIESIINKATGNDHYWQYDSKVWPRRTSICFPICGGLTEGEYIYKGKTYALPMHGFLREKEFTILEQSATKIIMEFVSNEETKAIYPFAFKFTLIQELSEESLLIHYKVENTGEDNMYYSIGSHYTYNVPIVSGETMSDYHYAFSTPQKAGKMLLESGAISGKSGDVLNGNSTLELSGLFDDGATILEISDIDPKYISIESKKTGAFTKVSLDGFSYCVLWAPKGSSPFACMEPWAGLLDQVGHDKNIVEKLGIKELKKGASNRYTQTITIG